MVEVFKTNVQDNIQAGQVISTFQCHFPDLFFNFDLEDQDKILRVEGIKILNRKIITSLVSQGYFCEVLL
jgi:hypothetical protein